VIIKFINFYLIILSRSLYFYNLMKRYIIKKQKKKEKKYLINEWKYWWKITCWNWNYNIIKFNKNTII
jgi:hypothetical protein